MTEGARRGISAAADIRACPLREASVAVEAVSVTWAEAAEAVDAGDLPGTTTHLKREEKPWCYISVQRK
jgi:hypothetical protein